MGKSNNVLLVLTVLLLFISIFGTATILGSFEPSPSRGTTASQTGKVSLDIIPMGKTQDSITGYVALTILPEDEE